LLMTASVSFAYILYIMIAEKLNVFVNK